MTDAKSIETLAQAESRWKKLGLFYTSMSVGALLLIFSVIDFADGDYSAGWATLAGTPVAALTMLCTRLDPMPRWVYYPILFYLLGLMCFMLAINLQQSSPLMWLFAAPALCMFCLGARSGVIISFCLLVIIVLALLYNDHILTPAYSIRFVCAYLLLTSVCYAFEHNREKATSQLIAAQARIKSLEELLPICAWCKKICSEDGTWESVETYITEHVQTDITHGVCPDCHDKIREGTQTQS